MFDSHACWRQKHVLKELFGLGFFFFFIQMDTWALLSPQNIHLLTLYLSSLPDSYVPLFCYSMCLSWSPLHLCIRVRNRSSEISGAVKLPEVLKADFEDWFTQKVYMSHKTSSRSAEMHLCGRKTAALGAIKILGESSFCSDQLLG